MGLNYQKLDQKVRAYMLDELKIDIEAATVYISERLNSIGKASYIDFLRDAMESGNDTTLASVIRNGHLNAKESRRTKNGVTLVSVPVTAADTLSEGEFNRYYIRALCREVIEEEQGQLVVYRAKAVSSPRIESEMKIGTIVDARSLLRDLRSNIGVDTALGLPAGPNSGLSVRIVGVEEITA
ncbi:hypothetical protein [Paenibacillus riograndensis]|uniref:Uncharacterized protein n=1 Tax=Paenibacillus riograndensis SBR5 TaxID=1073571 RepID=A0A0E4CUM4_9BACL|nr:hypothetical protein [Paenibacillus riograndensis]CQR52429.1 hypothetical protein PRIO_0823 [Paenibacillus riograndensis SBR5]